MVLESEEGIQFRTTELVDFNVDEDREISVYETNGLQMNLQNIL